MPKRIDAHTDEYEILWPNANPQKREVLFEMFRQQMIDDPDSSSMNFEIHRTDRKNLFPSAEAQEDLFDKIIAFYGANLMAQYERTGKTPKIIRVTLDIEQEV